MQQADPIGPVAREKPQGFGGQAALRALVAGDPLLHQWNPVSKLSRAACLPPDIGNFARFTETITQTSHPMKSSFKKSATAGLVAAALLFSAGCSRDDGKTAGQMVDDTAISAKVKTAFAQDPGVKAMEVKVDTFKGTVQLSGWVNTAEEKARAEEIAKGVPGVKTVENKIVLKTAPTPGKTSRPPDARPVCTVYAAVSCALTP